ncbi:hypothetical protein NMG60_11013773 [Bertholletia excelsa]
MHKHRSEFARRAWSLLRLALLWTRKNRGFKRIRFLGDPRLFAKSLKSLAHSTVDSPNLHYGERQLSFDNSPVVRVKMHRPSSMRFKMPHIPCIKPEVDFDYELEEDDDVMSYYNCEDGPRRSFLKGGEDEDGNDDCACEVFGCDDEGIDLKAEQFIAKFYEQIKLQSRVTYNPCNEKVN